MYLFFQEDKGGPGWETNQEEEECGFCWGNEDKFFFLFFKMERFAKETNQEAEVDKEIEEEKEKENKNKKKTKKEKYEEKKYEKKKREEETEEPKKQEQ